MSNDFDNIDDFDDIFGSSGNNDSSGFDDFNGFDDNSGSEFNTSSNSTSSFDGDFGSFGDENQLDESNDVQDDSGVSDIDFESQFSNNDANTQLTSEVPSSDLKKSAIIVAIIGVVLILVIIIVGAAISKKKANIANEQEHVTIVDDNSNSQQRTDINVDNIISSGDTQGSQESQSQQNTQVTNNKDTAWTELSGNEDIQVFDEYKDFTFTITDIKHYARLADNTLVVKTELMGSISGMSGTFTVDIPYNKGKQLSIGNEFSVQVLLGSFNGKNVVMDIKY